MNLISIKGEDFAHEISPLESQKLVCNVGRTLQEIYQLEKKVEKDFLLDSSAEIFL
jgi:hypothetical protein